MDEKVKWYQKSWPMWLALFFFPPLGLGLLFYNRDRHPRWKIIAVFGILWLFMLINPKELKKQPPPPPPPAVEQQDISAVEKDKANIEETIKSKLGDKVKNVAVSESSSGMYSVDFEIDVPSDDIEAAKSAAVAVIRDISPNISQPIEQYRAMLLHAGTSFAFVIYNTENAGNEGYSITRNGRTEEFDPNAPAPPPAAPSPPETQAKVNSSRQAPAAHVNNSGPGPNGETIKGNINRKGERIYHVPGGASYNKTIPEEWFFTEDEARAAGFRRAKR